MRKNLLSAAGGSGREHINELFEILSTPSLPYAHYLFCSGSLFSSPFSAKLAIHSSTHFILSFTSLYPLTPSKLTRTFMSSSGHVSIFVFLALSTILFHCLLALGSFILLFQIILYSFHPAPRLLTS